MIRRLTVLAASIVLGLSLTACTDQVGSAASVDGQSIAESFVASTAAQIGDASKTPVGNSQLLYRNRLILTNQIRHELITRVAAEQGVKVTDAEVNHVTSQGTKQLLQSLSGQNGQAYTEAQVPQAVRDVLLVLALAQRDQGKKATDVSVKADIINYPTRALAVAARTKYLADPSSMTAAVAAAKDQSNGGSQTLDLLQQPQFAAFGLFTEPAGSIILIDVDNSASLARITQRKVGASSELAANIQAASDSAGKFALAWLALAPYAASEKVLVNPRFGAWDPVALQVVPTQSGF